MTDGDELAESTHEDFGAILKKLQSSSTGSSLTQFTEDNGDRQVDEDQEVGCDLEVDSAREDESDGQIDEDQEVGGDREDNGDRHVDENQGISGDIEVDSAREDNSDRQVDEDQEVHSGQQVDGTPEDEGARQVDEAQEDAGNRGDGISTLIHPPSEEQTKTSSLLLGDTAGTNSMEMNRHSPNNTTNDDRNNLIARRIPSKANEETEDVEKQIVENRSPEHGEVLGEQLHSPNSGKLNTRVRHALSNSTVLIPEEDGGGGEGEGTVPNTALPTTSVQPGVDHDPLESEDCVFSEPIHQSSTNNGSDTAPTTPNRQTTSIPSPLSTTPPRASFRKTGIDSSISPLASSTRLTAGSQASPEASSAELKNASPSSLTSSGKQVDTAPTSTSASPARAPLEIVGSQTPLCLPQTPPESKKSRPPRKKTRQNRRGSKPSSALNAASQPKVGIEERIRNSYRNSGLDDTDLRFTYDKDKIEFLHIYLGAQASYAKCKGELTPATIKQLDKNIDDVLSHLPDWAQQNKRDVDLIRHLCQFQLHFDQKNSLADITWQLKTRLMVMKDELKLGRFLMTSMLIVTRYDSEKEVSLFAFFNAYGTRSHYSVFQPLAHGWRPAQQTRRYHLPVSALHTPSP